MKKIIILILAALPLVAQAQVAKQVDVEKDYTPSVSSAQKLSIVPDMTDTMMMRPDIDYTILPRHFQTDLIVHNFKPATITYWDFKRQSPLYARAAFGMPLMSEADIYASTHNKDRGYAMAYVNHWGDYRERTNLLGEKVSKYTTEMSNRIGGRAGLYMGRRTLEVELYGDDQVRHRYPSTSSMLHYGELQGKLRFGDDFADLERWNFNIEVGGGLFSDRRELEGVGKFNQSNFDAKVEMGKMVGQHLLKIHAAYSGIFGSKALESYSNGIITAGARYGVSGKRFEFILGADYSHDKVKNCGDSPHHIFPYMRMSWKNTSEGFVPFVEVDGKLKRHDLGSLMYENPYLKLSPEFGYHLSTLPNEISYNGRAGFSGCLGSGVFCYSLSAELSFADNHFYWYADQADYHFATAYQHSLRIDGEMKFRPAGCFEAVVTAGVYAWENYDSYYSNRPNFNTSLDLNYTGRRFTAGVGLEYNGGIKWQTAGAEQGKYSYTKTDGEFSLGVEAQYRIDQRWSVYVEGRNLTGSKLYDWLHYYRDSAQAVVGAKFAF